MLIVKVAQRLIALPRAEIGRCIGAVVQNDPGLQLTQMSDSLHILPIEAARVRLVLGARVPAPGKLNAAETQPLITPSIKPQNVELTVVRGEFINLPLVLFAKFDRIWLVDTGEEEAGVAPVKRRVVQPNAEPGLTRCLHKVGHEIVMGGGLHSREAATGIVEQRESVVMARSEHHVFHAASLGNTRP